jgi:hypothetical protein
MESSLDTTSGCEGGLCFSRALETTVRTVIFATYRSAVDKFVPAALWSIRFLVVTLSCQRLGPEKSCGHGNIL